MNNELRKALDMARLANVPKDVVDRNISRASDAKQGNYEEVRETPLTNRDSLGGRESL